ncbi:hypothetical protein NliqN6_6069 [Naganishia liquefaciens]|uniref:Uncharacterized protein n=1 Tax=Naganishia liquefaciens TaxID=104408 RepID=A0A8H3YJ00_9TREE|nr:hypothetical protein NliqN6_6069 [Naganishia liquefaciens]
MYEIPRRKVRALPRRKSKRLSIVDTHLQAIEQAGSPTVKSIHPQRESLGIERSVRSHMDAAGKGKGKMAMPVEAQSHRTSRTFTRSSSTSRPTRPHLRAFLDPSSPVYESPYDLRRQAQANHPSSLLRDGETSAVVFDSSSPLLDRRRPAPAHAPTPRLDIANPMYTLRPREAATRGQSEWISKRLRAGKPLMDSGL